MDNKIKIGLFGIGLDTYWAQFDGLLDKLVSFQVRINDRLEQFDTEVVDAGMVDNPDKAIAAARLFQKSGADMILLNISTYALSHNVLPLIQRISCPVVILNLQPSEAIDYERFNAMGDRGKMTGEWLSYCQSCVTPELASVFNRAGIKYNLITGYLDEESVWDEIKEWIDACSVLKVMNNNRVGVMGHYYNGMLDVYSDITLLAAAFGSHFELMEFGVLKNLFEKVTSDEISIKLKQFNDWFNVSDECSEADLVNSARCSVALDKLVQRYKLGSLAYYYEGQDDADYEKIVTTLIPGMTLLTGQNVPVTLLSVCQGGDGKITLLTAEGESVEGPTLQIGNTNSRYKFSLSARDFINRWSEAGPSHHCSIGKGNKSSVIKKLAELLGIEYIRIC